MARSAKMCMAKTYDGFIVILVARAIFIYIGVILAVHCIADGICFGA